MRENLYLVRCKKFIFSLNWSSYPLCYPWFWKTLQLASGNLFNWHMLVYYFIIFTIKRGDYIISVIIAICYYQLPINLMKILHKRIAVRICEVAHFSLSGFNSISCWSEYFFYFFFIFNNIYSINNQQSKILTNTTILTLLTIQYLEYNRLRYLLCLQCKDLQYSVLTTLPTHYSHYNALFTSSSNQ